MEYEDADEWNMNGISIEHEWDINRKLAILMEYNNGIFMEQ